MYRYHRVWPAVIIFSSLAAAIVVLADASGPLRAIISMWFAAVCPGMAFVRLLRIQQPFVEWSMGVALSLTIDTVVAAIMLYLNLWHPNAGLLILVVLSLVGVSLQLSQDLQDKGKREQLA